MPTDEGEARGVIAIFTAPDGDVIATVADFNRDGIGGCSLAEAQAMRAKEAVKWKVVRAYSSPVLADALSGYLLTQMSESLLAKGHKLTIRAIGWTGEIAAQVERR